MRMIAYKEGGVLILAIFVRTYYEDDPIAQCTLFIWRMPTDKNFKTSLFYWSVFPFRLVQYTNTKFLVIKIHWNLTLIRLGFLKIVCSIWPPPPPAHLQISRINKNADINCYMWRHLFLCNREMLKEGENLHIFWTTSWISMKFSENIWLIILSHKKQGFVFFLENTFLEKSQGEGQMDSAAFFGLRRSSKDKISIRNLIRFHGGFWVEDPRYFHNSFCWNLLFKIFYFKYY